MATLEILLLLNPMRCTGLHTVTIMSKWHLLNCDQDFDTKMLLIVQKGPKGLNFWGGSRHPYTA